jgi:nicotinamide-nucleotide amidase
VSRPAAAVLLTGSELLDGCTRDRNGFYLGESLSRRGARVTHVLIAPDDRDVLATGLAFLLEQRPSILVLSGGLGTTHDDLTAELVAQATGRPLESHPEAVRMVEATTRRVAARRGLDVDGLLPEMIRQALLPAGSRPIAPAGVAPGFVLRHEGTVLVALPGVPWEVEAMWPGVLDELARELGLTPGRSLILRCYGWGEVQVAAELRTLPTDLLQVAVTASQGEVRVVASHDEGDAAAAAQAEYLAAALRAAAPVFSSDGRTIDEIVADLLRGRGETVAVAESCTGGLLGGRLTELPGSSDYFLGGVISYTDAIKGNLLGVPADVLAEHGAVSRAVARSMAQGVRDRLGSTYGLSVTGIAGPAGGTPHKPVGLVYVGCAAPAGTLVRRHQSPGDRSAVRDWSTTAALHLLREALQA